MIWLLLAISASMLGDFGFGLLLLGAFLLEWFYPIVFEVYGQGQTPGKRSCGLAVVHDDGRPIGWSAAFIRNTLRGIDFLPLLYAAGFVSSLMNAQGKRIGDLAAAILLTVERQFQGTINWDTGEGICVLQIADAVAALLGCPELAGEVSPPESDPLDYVMADATRLRGLGWGQQCSLDQGLSRLTQNLQQFALDRFGYSRYYHGPDSLCRKSFPKQKRRQAG